MISEYALKINGSQRVQVVANSNGRVTYHCGDSTRTESKRKFKQKYMWVKGGRV